MLYTLWVTMTSSERMPFEALHKKHIKREQDNPPLTDPSRAIMAVQKKKEVDDIPRCETALTAKTLLAGKKAVARPLDSVIRRAVEEKKAAFAAQMALVGLFVADSVAAQPADMAPSTQLPATDDQVESKVEQVHANVDQAKFTTNAEGEVIDLTKDDVDEVTESNEAAVSTKVNAEENVAHVDVEMKG
jgi:hypothetical protein